MTGLCKLTIEDRLLIIGALVHRAQRAEDMIASYSNISKVAPSYYLTEAKACADLAQRMIRAVAG